MLSVDAPVRSRGEKPPTNVEGLPVGQFHRLPHVIDTRVCDALVVMDRKRGAFFTLNPVTARIWELACDGTTPDEAIEKLLQEYDVSRSQLEHDVVATFRQLIGDELLAPGIAPNPLRTVRRSKSMRAGTYTDGVQVPSVLVCGLLVAWIKGLLRFRGFLGTLDWIGRRTESIPATTQTAVETVRAAEYAVAMASALYPGRAQCLERSLALYYILRRAGIAAKYCHGVTAYPFQAHAWIEYRGEVINDVPEHARFFTPLPDQLP